MEPQRITVTEAIVLSMGKKEICNQHPDNYQDVVYMIDLSSAMVTAPDDVMGR